MALKYELFACVQVAPSLRTRCPILGKSQNPCFYFLSLKLEYIDFFQYVCIFNLYMRILVQIGKMIGALGKAPHPIH